MSRPRARSIEQAVRSALGRQGRKYTRAQLAPLIRAFIEAGSHAVRRRSLAGPSGAARMITDAKQLLSRGRCLLAETTRPGHPPVLRDPAWRAAKAALERHKTELLTIPGVVGFGLGYRRRRGVRIRGERCVMVLVTRKYSDAALRRHKRRRIPKYLYASERQRVAVDVVAFGTMRRLLEAGSSLGPRGVPDMGTIGTFAVDLLTSQSVALTAMHVTGDDEFPPGPGQAFVTPSELLPNSRRLGDLLRGSMHGIDAAVISIAASHNVTMRIHEVGPIKGWRPLSHPGDIGTMVRMFGARTNKTVFGTIVETDVALPQFELDAAILVDIPSQNGDSGAAIVDNENLVLGLLAGESSKLGGLRVFTPISNVLARLACDIPTL